MEVEIPLAVRPAFRFCVHVVLGSFAFMIVFMVAVGVDMWMDWAAAHGAHPWMVNESRWVAAAIFWLDIFGLALFLFKETIKLARSFVLDDWN